MSSVVLKDCHWKLKVGKGHVKEEVRNEKRGKEEEHLMSRPIHGILRKDRSQGRNNYFSRLK